MLRFYLDCLRLLFQCLNSILKAFSVALNLDIVVISPKEPKGTTLSTFLAKSPIYGTDFILNITDYDEFIIGTAFQSAGTFTKSSYQSHALFICVPAMYTVLSIIDKSLSGLYDLSEPSLSVS